MSSFSNLYNNQIDFESNNISTNTSTYIKTINIEPVSIDEKIKLFEFNQKADNLIKKISDGSFTNYNTEADFNSFEKKFKKIISKK